jgi:hypothetical protein
VKQLSIIPDDKEIEAARCAAANSGRGGHTERDGNTPPAIRRGTQAIKHCGLVLSELQMNDFAIRAPSEEVNKAFVGATACQLPIDGN